MSASAHTDAGHGGDPVPHAPGHSQHNYAHDALDLEDGLWQEAVFARLPDDAPQELHEYVSDIENPRRVWAVYRASRRHDFQLLVDRYVNPTQPSFTLLCFALFPSCCEPPANRLLTLCRSIGTLRNSEPAAALPSVRRPPASHVGSASQARRPFDDIVPRAQGRWLCILQVRITQIEASVLTCVDQTTLHRQSTISSFRPNDHDHKLSPNLHHQDPERLPCVSIPRRSIPRLAGDARFP